MTTPPYLKFILCLILFYCLISCKETGEVKLELQNKQIYHTDLPKIRGDYESNTSRQKSQNIITYTLSNTTNKKLLFLFEPQDLSPSAGISPTTQYYGYVGFTITDRNDNIKKFYPHLPMWAETSDLSGCELYQLQKKRDMYAKLEVETQKVDIVDRFINHSIVLYPGETRTFKALLKLPIVWETDRSLQKGGLYYPELEEGDAFKLFYYCKAGELRNSLPKYIQEELTENEIEIFDGKLSANPVKLKKR